MVAVTEGQIAVYATQGQSADIGHRVGQQFDPEPLGHAQALHVHSGIDGQAGNQGYQQARKPMEAVGRAQDHAMP